MKVLQPQAFGEKRTNNTFTINKFTKVEQLCTPFLKAFATCRVCDRTAVPYSQYVPENQEGQSGAGKSYKHFQLRFDIMIYALACYPSGFSRHAIMQKNTSTVRTQQRILQSLVREGFLSKNQPYLFAGVYFKAIPSKLHNMVYAINSTKKSKGIDVSGFLPKYSPTPTASLNDTNKIYQQAIFRFDLSWDILTYAAACGDNGFSRKDVMQNMSFIKERTQQRLLERLVQAGFLIKIPPKNGKGCTYYFNKSKIEPLLKLLNRNH